jgi:hypothetical protein
MVALIRFFSSRVATLKREFAIAAFGVWLAVTVRVFLSGDAAWIAAQGVNYATISSTVWLYITAAVGLQVWENREAARPADPAPPPTPPTPPPDAGVPG